MDRSSQAARRVIARSMLDGPATAGAKRALLDVFAALLPHRFRGFRASEMVAAAGSNGNASVSAASEDTS
jgi:hypothetical protein